MAVLALNASYEPMSRPMDLKRALRLVLQDKADIVESEGEVRTVNGPMPKPVVIRLRKLVKIPRRLRRKVTNTFLFARDAYRCQYCGKHASELGGRNELTRDHVLPLSRGGENTWENCVTACSKCNWQKANRLPHEAGMKLRKEPTVPHIVYLVWQVRKLTPKQRKYIALFYGADAIKQVEDEVKVWEHSA